MSKIIQAISKRRKKRKLTINKIVTNTGLFLFTHNHRMKDVKKKKNISYGKSHLQKFDIISPKNVTEKLPVVFYIHGGAWSAGDKYGYTMFCQNLAKEGYIVCNINYRLMPKVDIKSCVDDCVLAIKHFAKHNEQILSNAKISALPDFDHTYFVGDSAGAHLSSLLAGLLTTNKIQLPIKIKALGLYYGVYDFEHLDDDPSPIMQDLNNYWKMTDENIAEVYHYISSTNYVTENYPPCFLTSGAIDKLHLQTEVFVKLLQSYKIKIDYLSFDKKRLDAEHAFLNASFLPSARQAFERLTKFFKEHNDDEKE